MSKRLMALAIGSLLATSTGWTAENNRASKEEGIAVGTGAMVGAAAGGPIGFIIGAAFGGWLGDRFHHEKVARRDAEEAHLLAQGNVVTLNGRIATSERELERLTAELRGERASHRSELEQALAIEVFFRTEQSTLDEPTGQRLAELAKFIAPLDDTLIQLEGFTDKRGDDDYNAELAAARATAVRDALVSGGVPAERIMLTAQGETLASAEEEDVDGMALDRRVAMRLVDADSHRVALQQTTD